ncbi:MAG: ParB/RepB/Spo0J family partition protein [Bacilli bacterium]|nr:ParB/RepB/Spo0J family partition protein [Bacilli bacterium]MDD4547296.1 ParB/RepB/Spo0J family partition protein [Bacilli bacterium]
MNENIPDVILDVGFDFDWDEEDVWKLNYPTKAMNIKKLEWHFDMPFWNYDNKWYNLKPIDVIKDNSKYKDEYNRIMKANLDYPIDIMKNKDKYVILDGLHRLVKAKILGYSKVNVRIIPRTEINNIKK